MESKLNYINPCDISFSCSESGLLFASFKGREKERVAPIRMFPLQYEEEFISVRRENYQRSDKETEIGIIRTLDDFPEEEKKLILNELERRYFAPRIKSVISVKEELGNTFWKVETDKGENEFTMTDMNTNVTRLTKGRVMLTDVYSNRYFIPDITKLDDKALKIIEVWI